jgi:hypothetical protein
VGNRNAQGSPGLNPFPGSPRGFAFGLSTSDRPGHPRGIPA